MGQHANIFGTERFWKRFDAKVTLIPFSDCHYWTGTQANHSYGEIKVDGRMERAHRVAFQRRYGPIPAGTLIRHRCDQPMCVNPDHLETGTQTENMGDAAKRQRMPLGERHWNNKLTDADLSALQDAFARGESTGDLAKRYGVSPGRISMIRHGKVGRNHPAYRGEAA